MRVANTSVKRVRHPIPTIDELLQDMNSSKIFSKLDVTWAYHQIVLKPESREITTFVTHKGIINKGNNKITELRTILQRESQNS